MSSSQQQQQHHHHNHNNNGSSHTSDSNNNNNQQPPRKAEFTVLAENALEYKHTMMQVRHDANGQIIPLGGSSHKMPAAVVAKPLMSKPHHAPPSDGHRHNGSATSGTAEVIAPSQPPRPSSENTSSGIFDTGSSTNSGSAGHNNHSHSHHPPIPPSPHPIQRNITANSTEFSARTEKHRNNDSPPEDGQPPQHGGDNNREMAATAAAPPPNAAVNNNNPNNNPKVPDDTIYSFEENPQKSCCIIL